MINQLISFLIILLLAGCVIYALNWFIGLLSIPQPIKNIILLMIGIISLLWLLQWLGVYTFPL